ncbi:TPA: glucose-6-phosphate isomerase [Legionella pneumophila]|uniref:glucose-6-phosphate isomerase n=1 Tax=Legionella pneumophila TaxID=446 RepID=UPI0004832F8E|nr:glucose-6-phosphate isomerase [Legionella pneumophila]RYW93360.1 glucose-6-phosphate isomerase [Legionella pneumophila]STX98239.1 glucose-6-phosphate isomerase [Legionella pneumophila]HAT1774439.1 glucose-6-phosphate isomerase [Legionella pneumophila]HAT1777196.1 glucose-6-phosphate isomerase [Legionella pneumophila]HAT2017683.1 glucose-6-phosphate isomerase [Legionella pneumophila]
MKRQTELPIWNLLQQEADKIRLTSGSQLTPFMNGMHLDYCKQINTIEYDYSRQKVNNTILDLLINLANEIKLQEKIDGLIRGEKVNISENRSALHTALRDLSNKSILIDGLDIMSEVVSTREKIRMISNRIREKKWLGYSGLPITDIVNIGIGGSDLGPRVCIHALSNYVSKEFNYHFISDVDPASFNDVIAKINPQTTLFIVSSKSFTTKETLLNARKAFALYEDMASIDQHFIAVTAYPERAYQMGIKTVLPIWDWVGGRFSFCSAVNLITAIAIGYEQFVELLAGAHDIDTHVQFTDFKNNIPVLMALIGVWNNNFLNIHNLLILTYSKKLEYFVPYVQQLDMESNGKSIDVNGRMVDYATGPIVWGGLGNQAQHSYFQLLCQGTHRCVGDFITLKTNDEHEINSMCHYKMKVLSEGIQTIENPYGYIPGNMPMNHLILSDCSPYTLGALVALYEHKIFVQSVIWNINPFDQPGIESAKSAHREITLSSES